MIKKEIILNTTHGTNEEWITFAEVEACMHEYAKHVLEIAAEKAKIKQKPLHPLLVEYEGIRNPCIDLFKVDKSSIINCLKK